MPDPRNGDAAPQPIYLKDYQPPAWWVDSVGLVFELEPSATLVTAMLEIRRNPDHPGDGPRQPLRLDGEALELVSVALDDRLLGAGEYLRDEESLTIEDTPDAFTLKLVTRIDPASNTSLMGLYRSSGNFCTQCEAEGFRKISYFPDRPDVLARYTVTLIADAEKYPVLLSNGNLIESGAHEPGADGRARHYATWHDPHPKPSYLFALVAGDLAQISDTFTTMSGREVALHIYVQHHNADQCDHAMRSLINAMRWDEQVYGREYDLDVFNLVAVDDFNMGAMENKGLNIFNSKFVLARPDTATDNDYQNIEGVVGHEYFHNWSGNRVTCRDWFQLSLKEGFTVFRDQEFSADMSARGVKRIQDVNMLRTHQFREDGGPMAHPIRPESYVEINNFYTLTVYEKGAEVVRMLHHLLGAERFRAGTDLYFERHDGQAVTTDDFVQALEDASGIDLSQFRRWYAQAGTPVLDVSEAYDGARGEYALTIRQHTPPTPGQIEKLPLHIPVSMGLLGADGESLPLRLADDEGKSDQTTRVLHLCEPEHTFVFTGLKQRPVVSLLRGFSAPVKLRMRRSVAEQAFLMAHDVDDFNRWDAAQTLAEQLLLTQIDAQADDAEVSVDDGLLDAIAHVLEDQALDPALAAEMLRLPAETLLADAKAPANPDHIHRVREAFRAQIAQTHRDLLWQVYERLTADGYSLEPAAMARRALRNQCLAYLMAPERAVIDDGVFDACAMQFREAGNMTDTIAALACLVNTDDPYRAEALDAFYARWRGEALVLDKWFMLQATSRLPGTLNIVQGLMQHEDFHIKNPNRVRSLIGAFAQANPAHFHQADGAGYAFVADQVITLDGLNPQIAARLVNVFTRWRQYDEARQQHIHAQLGRIARKDGLSRDVYEIVSKSLTQED